MNVKTHLALLLAAAGTVAWAQTGEFLSAPRIGWAASEDSRELRAILGVPGAGRVSDLVALPGGISRVWIAPGQQYALGYGEETGSWRLLSLRDESLFTVTNIEGIAGSPGIVAFGPGGAAAAVTDAGNTTAYILSISPDSPQKLWSVAIGEASRIAVSASGDMLLVAGKAGVNLYRRGGETVPLASLPDVSAMSFHPSLDTAAIAGAGGLMVAERLSSQPAIRTLGGGEAIQPGVAAWSQDGRFLWCADRSSNALIRVELATGQVDRFGIDVPVTRLDVLAGTSHFLISSPEAGHAAWMLLASPDKVDTYFVPGIPIDVAALPSQGAQQ